jgi:Uma2 family endonuclease
MAVRPKSLIIDPSWQGRRVSLARFAHADAEPGRVYELERGVVQVVDVPGLPHGRIVRVIRAALERYAAAHPRAIDHLAGGQEGVLRMWRLQSERHPDVMVYLTPPPAEVEQPWDEWTPEIVIEVVSDSSRQRDYLTKAQEYLAVGIREYWVIDPRARSATIHIRRGDTWRKQKIGRSGAIRTALLPGFALRLADVFDVLRRRK